jgi:hypothetical protein
MMAVHVGLLQSGNSLFRDQGHVKGLNLGKHHTHYKGAWYDGTLPRTRTDFWVFCEHITDTLHGA